MASAQRARQENGNAAICGFKIADGGGAAESRGEGADDRDADLHRGKEAIRVVFQPGHRGGGRTPLSSRASMRLLRMAIMAISDAAKKPLARINTKIKIGFKPKSSLGSSMASPGLRRVVNEGQIALAMLADRQVWSCAPRTPCIASGMDGMARILAPCGKGKGERLPP